MKKIRRIFSLTVMTTMVISVGACFSFADINKASTNSNNSVILSSVSGMIGVGYCTGDGVKFKSEPNASSVTLGLIYKGEKLYLQDSPDGMPSSWVYVYRIKTNQYGYMAAQYFSKAGTPK